MKTYDFKVLLEPEETGGYVATCPSLPGCYSQGDTVDGALDNIREAIELCLEDMRADGEAIRIPPEPGPERRRHPITSGFPSSPDRRPSAWPSRPASAWRSRERAHPVRTRGLCDGRPPITQAVIAQDTMNQLRTARQSRGWTQARAAARLGVSQPYLAMLEAGQRPLTSAVARQAMRVYGLPPTVLSPGVAPRVRPRRSPRTLRPSVIRASPTSRAGAARRSIPARCCSLPSPSPSSRRARLRPCPGCSFATGASTRPGLSARPRCATSRPPWLRREPRARGGRARGHGPRLAALRALEAALERSRLAREDTLGPRCPLRGRTARLETRRSAAARHWNLLTDWTAEALRHRA